MSEMEELQKQVSLLEPEDGDVVVVKAAVITGELRRALLKMLPENVAIIILTTGESIETMDEEAMRKLGWVREVKGGS